MTQSTFTPQPGYVIGHKYRIERVLGQGGMGLVFEASHVVTAKRFAIKWLLSDRSNSDGAVARFVREAQVAGRCEHRNIVEVYDIDREGEAMFMVMELLKGESLAERLARGGALHASDACRLLLPCIEAVGEAHAAGIIHRDLKPANIFICQARGREPEMAKVLDFGVSRFASTQEAPMGVKTKDGTVIGTPFYMSPEQMRSQPIDLRADVYSMGITFYEVLSGVRPYNAHSYGDLLLKVADANPIPLGELVMGLPTGLVQIVDKAMSFDRNARFADMREFANALEAYGRPRQSGGRTLLVGSSSNDALSIDTPWVSESNSFNLETDESVKSRTTWRRIVSAGAGVALLVGGVMLWNSQTESADLEQVAPRPLAPPTSTTSTATNAITQTPGSVHEVPAAGRADAGIVEPAASPEAVAVPVGQGGESVPAGAQAPRGRRGGSRSSRAHNDEQASEETASPHDTSPDSEDDSSRGARNSRNSATSPSSPARNRVKNRAHATMERSDF
jgi:serine/threonine protein kinase